MSASATIVRAEARHLDEVLRLLTTQLRDHQVEVDDATLAAAVRAVLDDARRGFILVAEVDGRCAGVAFVGMFWSLEHGGRSAWLDEFFVLPEFRGTGIGTKLLEAVAAACRTLGCKAIDLEIDAAHERVRGLYERHGWTPVPRRRMVRRFAR